MENYELLFYFRRSKSTACFSYVLFYDLHVSRLRFRGNFRYPIKILATPLHARHYSCRFTEKQQVYVLILPCRRWCFSISSRYGGMLLEEKAGLALKRVFNFKILFYVVLSFFGAKRLFFKDTRLSG